MTKIVPPLAPTNTPELGTSGRLLARAALLTAGLTVAGALLGLLRDQAFAHYFGADTDTDAFLVAWTVPEVAATLLIEDGLAFVLVPAFSLALVGRARRTGPDPVRALVAATLPRLMLALAGGGAVLIAAAPAMVAVLAPGLPRADLAVDCTRLTATCVFTFGLTGYCSAALRGHGRFLAPASIYVAYNVGIIALLLALGRAWGVRAAAAGVALGGVLMILVQLPALWRSWRDREPAVALPAARRAPPGPAPAPAPSASATPPPAFPPPVPPAPAPARPTDEGQAFGGGDIESGATMRFSPSALKREFEQLEAAAAAARGESAVPSAPDAAQGAAPDGPSAPPAGADAAASPSAESSSTEGAESEAVVAPAGHRADEGAPEAADTPDATEAVASTDPAGASDPPGA
ncbi:lipid II flippase MurJ, partial [Streptomyces violascens]|uniref:lipid II flippase MurJ n=1 Tax=Streptomyces violascens TaxID=67381 RepID=UPI00369DEF9C